MATIKLYLPARKTNAGLYNISLYVNQPGWKMPFRKGTSVLVDAERWDESLQQVKGKGNEVKRMNLILQQKKSLANDILTDYTLMRRDLSYDQFAQEYENPIIRGDFLAFWERKMGQNYERRLISEATLTMEKRTLRKLREYQESVSFSEISRAWLESFDSFHARELEKAGVIGARERERALKHVKKYINQANDEMPDAKIPDPFRGFKWPRYKSSPVALTEDEVLTILEYYQSADAIYYRMVEMGRERGLEDYHIEQYASQTGVTRLKKVMRGFLFQCLSGVRYSDLKQIHYNHIEDGYLVFTPEKTKDTSGREVRMLITPALQLLIGKGKGRIFEVFVNQVQNRYLKEIADVCSIKKRLTSHVGRHTFATLGIAKGVSLPVLADLMGLASIKTLLMYVHTNQQMRDDAMQKLMIHLQ